MRCLAVVAALLIVAAVATTLPEYVDRCSADLATDKSSDCGTDALFCTGYAYLGLDSDGEPERKLGCRPCEVMPSGAQRNGAVFDPLNVCNCVGGMFCRHTGPAEDLSNRVIGYCEQSTLVGTPCNTTDECIGAREASTDGGAARREVGFCVNGKCAQCDPANFATAMGAAQHVCPGYVRQSSGQRVYHNSMPGVVISCSADGALVASGQPNFELKAGDAPPPEHEHQPTAKLPDYVPALLAVVFVLVLCIAALLSANLVGLLAVLWSRRPRKKSRTQLE
jgi:hypothetical protein